MSDKKVIEQTIYKCPHCQASEGSSGFATKDEALEHIDSCIYNPDNESIATSKFLGVELRPRKNKNIDAKMPHQVAELLNGAQNRAYDTRTGEYVSGEDFYKPLNGYEEAEKVYTGEIWVYKPPEITYTDEFKNTEQYKLIKKHFETDGDKVS